MNEDFLSYIWMFRLYKEVPVLTDGRVFSVEAPGILNRDSGPDFSGARIRIDNTLWVGNVEVHIKSSDWHLHGHHNDPAFETVILHVVFKHDADVVLADHTRLPVFEMEKYIDSGLYTRYLQFMASPNDIACESLVKHNRLPVSGQWLVSLGLQRLMRKGEELDYLVKRLGGDWLEVFYVSFCRSFGNKVNDDIFEMLALKTPLKLIHKYSNSRVETEALLFGQSGLLPDDPSENRDPYVRSLAELYKHIVYQHDCEQLDPHLWRFMRTRPANFPTIRIAQLAALIRSFAVLNPMMPEEIVAWMKSATSVQVTEYWQSHYNFGKAGTRLPQSIGKESVVKLIINGMLPPLLKYGEIYKNHEYISSLIDLVSSIPPEDNRIIRRWNQLKINATSALETQGLAELFNEYCRMKKCLDCRFGHHLFAQVF